MEVQSKDYTKVQDRDGKTLCVRGAGGDVYEERDRV